MRSRTAPLMRSRTAPLMRSRTAPLMRCGTGVRALRSGLRRAQNPLRAEGCCAGRAPCSEPSGDLTELDRRPVQVALSDHQAVVPVVLGTVVVVIGQPATFHVAVELAMPESGVHLTVVALTPFGTWKTTAPVCDSPVLSLSRLLVPE